MSFVDQVLSIDVFISTIRPLQQKLGTRLTKRTVGQSLVVFLNEFVGFMLLGFSFALSCGTRQSSREGVATILGPFQMNIVFHPVHRMFFYQSKRKQFRPPASVSQLTGEESHSLLV